MFGSFMAVLAAVVVPLQNPSWEHVVADVVLTPAGNGVDDAVAIQKALDDVGERQGGGTVFLTAGVWVLKSPLVIPANTAIKGDYTCREVRRSTRLEIRFGAGDENAASPITLLAGACLQGVWMCYPEQSLAKPTPYPWTIVHGADVKRRNASVADHQTVRDVTIVNAWKGIRIGSVWNELHTIRDVRLTALAAGMYFDNCTDIGRLIDVTVSPEVWASSGLAGAPTVADLQSYLKAHAVVAAEYGRSDWEYVWRLKVKGYGVGLKYGRGKRGQSNSVVAESLFEDCDVGMELNELNAVGLAVYDTTFFRCETPVYLTKRFYSFVQFDACDFGGGVIRNEGTPSSVVVVHPAEGMSVRHRPMIPPRPESARLVDARAFGLDAKASDNAVTLQHALDHCAAQGGGTVYVPAGYYNLTRGVKVPTGVELRGSSPAPHHTCSAGTVLLVRYGQGDENGEPTVQLASKAGLRGVTVWYPENPRNNPLPYPWAIRSLGADTYLMDVCVANAWRIADFATFPSDGHRIAYVTGNAWCEGLKIGNSARDGWVEETLFNPHYSVRLPRDLPTFKGELPAAWHAMDEIPAASRWMRKRFDAHQFIDCAREHIRGTFVYAAREGFSLRGKTVASVVMHGSDTVARGMEIDLAASGKADVVQAQLTPYETDSGLESAGFHFAQSDCGTSVFHASQLWCAKPTIVAEGHGCAAFVCANTLSDPVIARSGTLDFVDVRFMQYDDTDWLERSDAAKVTARRTGGYPVDPVRLPKVAPKDVTLDMVASRPPDNVVAPHGGCRNVAAWSLVTTNGEARFTAKITSGGHAYIYPLLWQGETTIGPTTKLIVAAKALNGFSTSAGRFSFDFVFADGTVARETGGPVRIGMTTTDGFTTFRLPLRTHCGKTVKVIMGRIDVRGVPGDYAMAFRDVRLFTAK